MVFTTVIVTGLLGCELNISGRQLAQMTLLILSGVGAVLGYSHYLEKKAEKSVFDQEYKREKWYALNVKVSFLIFLPPPPFFFFAGNVTTILKANRKKWSNSM